MKLIIQHMNELDAGKAATWNYQPPYSMYSLSPNEIPLMLDPANRYFSDRDEADRLVGYCCFGEEAKVAGGDCSESEPEVIDVGIGMNPDLAGKGFGAAFVAAIIDFATDEYNPTGFRVSIAEFNKRSQKVFLNLGFVETGRFVRDSDGMRFLLFERDAS